MTVKSVRYGNDNKYNEREISTEIVHDIQKILIGNKNDIMDIILYITKK